MLATSVIVTCFAVQVACSSGKVEGDGHRGKERVRTVLVVGVSSRRGGGRGRSTDGVGSCLEVCIRNGMLPVE